MALMVSEAAFTLCSAVWPVLMMASLSCVDDGFIVCVVGSVFSTDGFS